MSGWYRAEVDHALPPARVTLERITEERMKFSRTLPPPGGEHPHFHDACPRRRLSTYGGRGQVGGVKTTGAQVGRPLPY